MKMEPIEGSETSAFRTQTPGNYPKENILQVNISLLHLTRGVSFNDDTVVMRRYILSVSVLPYNGCAS